MIGELRELRAKYPVLDMPNAVIDEIATPPRSPKECIFARTTETISADLTTEITPCQFGGKPDCSNCGCIASMGLAAVGHYKLIGPLTAGHIFLASDSFGKSFRRFRDSFKRVPAAVPEPQPFKII